MEHVGGPVHSYSIPCKSIPINLDKNELLAKIANAPAQSFDGKMSKPEYHKKIRSRIDRLLRNRRVNTDEIRAEWDTFFSRLPSAADPLKECEHPNVLADLLRTLTLRTDRGKSRLN